MNNFGQENPRIINPDVAGMNSFFRKIYSYVAMAMLVSAATAYLGVTFFAPQIAAIFSSTLGSLLLFGLMLVFVAIMSRKVFTNPGAAFGMLMGYAVMNGVFFSVIGLTINARIIGMAFLSTAFLYIGMAAYGWLTKKSMASMRTFLMGALIALIVASLINIFFFNSLVYLLTSVIGIIVFALLTAYDVNTIKQQYNQYLTAGQGDVRIEQGLAISGALNLYLDFINMFMYFIQLFTAFGGDNR